MAMTSVAPLNVRLPTVKRRYPRVLLIAPRDDERHRAMLLLTAQRFVVDDCKAAAEVIGMWAYATKYDAVLVLPDIELDPSGAFAIQDIRRKEVEPSRQQKSEAAVNLHTRLNEHAGKQLAPHRAQRFAEQQLQKQQMLQALERVRLHGGGAGGGSLADRSSAANSCDSVAADFLHRTFVIGFDANQHEQYVGMEVSGNYDYILHGVPSDSHNVSFLAHLLQAQYPIAKFEAVPSFEVVVKSLREFQEARKGTREPAADRSGRQQSSSLKGDEGMAASAYRTSFNPQAAGNSRFGDVAAASTRSAVAPSGAASALGSLSVNHDALHAAHVHAQLHEAEHELTELVAARDAAESELQKSQAECQRLRSTLKEAVEHVEHLTDVKQSLAEQLQSRNAEIASMQREFDVQLRCFGLTQNPRQARRSSTFVPADGACAVSAIGDSSSSAAGAQEPAGVLRRSSVVRGELIGSGPDALTKTAASALEEMRTQQQRLRDLVFKYETALHELAIHNRLLQRRLDAVTMVGGASPGGQNRKRRGSRGRRRSSVALLADEALAGASAATPRRHPSLAKLSLPCADEMFRSTAAPPLSSSTADASGSKHHRVVVGEGRGDEPLPGALMEDDDPLTVMSGGSSTSTSSTSGTSTDDDDNRGARGSGDAKDDPAATETRRRKSFLRQSLRDLRVPRKLSILAQRVSRTSEKLSQAQGRNEHYEAALMLMHDRESHAREAVDAAVDFLMSDATAEKLTATRFSSRSIPLTSNSLVASWSTIEAELQATAKSLGTSLQSFAPPSALPLTASGTSKARRSRPRLGSAGRRAQQEEQEALRVKTMLQEQQVSTLAALELLPVVRDALDPVVHALDEDFSSFHSLVMQALSHVAGSYDALLVAARRCPKLQLARPTSTTLQSAALGAASVATTTDTRANATGSERLMRVASKVSPSTPPIGPSPPESSSSVSLVNLMLLQQTALFKKCLANLRRARVAHENDLQALLSAALATVATAVTPLKATILAAMSRGEVKPVYDANTQTDISGGGHHRSSISHPHHVHLRPHRGEPPVASSDLATDDCEEVEGDQRLGAPSSFSSAPSKPTSRNGSTRFRATQFCD